MTLARAALGVFPTFENVKKSARRSRKEVFQHWLSKWRHRYRLVLLDESSFEERFSMVLNRRNVFLSVGGSVLFLIVSTMDCIHFLLLLELDLKLQQYPIRLFPNGEDMVLLPCQESCILH